MIGLAAVSTRLYFCLRERPIKFMGKSRTQWLVKLSSFPFSKTEGWLFFRSEKGVVSLKSLVGVKSLSTTDAIGMARECLVLLMETCVLFELLRDGSFFAKGERSDIRLLIPGYSCDSVVAIIHYFINPDPE